MDKYEKGFWKELKRPDHMPLGTTNSKFIAGFRLHTGFLKHDLEDTPF